MVTTNDILELKWQKLGVAADGGSRSFSKFTSLGIFLLANGADNFIYKQRNDPRLNEIKIEKLIVNANGEPNFDTEILYQGSPENKEELKLIISKLPINLKDYRKEKLKKINSHEI